MGLIGHSYVALLLGILSQMTGIVEAAAPITGDRLIVAVNNYPYSQLQIESYLDIKEALRDDPTHSQLVDPSNWRMATQSFAHDMILYQEANRTSGFRPSKELQATAAARVKKTLASEERYRVRFQQLGIDDGVITERVSQILAIESLRKSRNTAKTPSKEPDPVKSGATKTSTNWESELTLRAVIRWFDNHDTWLDLRPNL